MDNQREMVQEPIRNKHEGNVAIHLPTGIEGYIDRINDYWFHIRGEKLGFGLFDVTIYNLEIANSQWEIMDYKTKNWRPKPKLPNNTQQQFEVDGTLVVFDD